MTRIVLDNGDVNAQCKHCKKVFLTTSKNGTSRLNRHIASCVARRYKALSCYEDWGRVKGFTQGPSKTLKISDEGCGEFEDEEDTTGVIYGGVCNPSVAN